MKKVHNSVKLILIILSVFFLVLGVMNMGSLYKVTLARLSNNSARPFRIHKYACNVFNQFHNQTIRVFDSISGFLLFCSSLLFATGAFREFVKKEPCLAKKQSHPELLVGAIIGFLAGLTQLIGYLNFEKGGEYLLTDVIFPPQIWALLIGNALLIALWWILNKKPYTVAYEPATGTISNRMRAICAGVIVCFGAFTLANACGYFGFIYHRNSEFYSFSEILYFCDYLKEQNINLSKGLYNSLFVTNIAATVTMLLGVIVSLYGTYKESKYVLPFSGILGMIAFSAQSLSYVFTPDIEDTFYKRCYFAPGFYHYGGFLLFAIVFTVGIASLRRKKAV